MMNIVLAKAYLAMNTVMMAAADATSTSAAAADGGADFSKITKPIINLITSMLWPAIGIVGAIGTLYCVLLGVKFAKAEEPQEHEKAKNHLKNAIIGFVLIFILLFALWGGTKIMENWYTGVVTG